MERCLHPRTWEQTGDVLVLHCRLLPCVATLFTSFGTRAPWVSDGGSGRRQGQGDAYVGPGRVGQDRKESGRTLDQRRKMRDGDRGESGCSQGYRGQSHPSPGLGLRVHRQLDRAILPTLPGKGWVGVEESHDTRPVPRERSPLPSMVTVIGPQTTDVLLETLGP